MAFENWKLLLTEINSHPIKVKAITSGIVYVLGDFISQLSSKKIHLGQIDRLRLLRSGLAGFLLHGPLLGHYWYIYCDMLFKWMKCTQWWSVIIKVAIDQLVLSPLWTGTYIAFIGIL
jgi:hypothetical protein